MLKELYTTENIPGSWSPLNTPETWVEDKNSEEGDLRGTIY